MFRMPRGVRTAVELGNPATLAAFSAPPVDPAPKRSSIESLIVARRAETVMRAEAMRIPAVRRAVHVLMTISTFQLAAWVGTTRVTGPAWLGQPDPKRTLIHTLRQLLDDLIWHDRSYLRIRRDIAGQVAYLSHVSISRVTPTHDPDDVDAPGRALLDGNPAELLCFDGGGLGGLQRFGGDLLALYKKLQDAAGVYADNPAPTDILKNTSDEQLTDDEIDELLEEWTRLRRLRSTAYLNGSLDYEKSTGWNAREMQLVEGREHAALEVARMFGLPSRALNAATNDSMTYSNVAEERRDRLEAIRPWMTTIEQTFSLNDRTGVTSGLVVPRGMSIRFDSNAYTRDDPATRMDTWAVALTNKILTLDEVRNQEPLAW